MGISEDDDDEAVNKETETNDDKSIKSSGGKFWPMFIAIKRKIHSILICKNPVNVYWIQRQTRKILIRTEVDICNVLTKN